MGRMRTPYYSSTPTKAAMGDVVSGPGVLRVPASRAAGQMAQPPSAPLLPRSSQMIGVDEALAPVRQRAAEVARGTMPRDARPLRRLADEFAAENAAPFDLLRAQELKDQAAEAAARLYRTGKGPNKAVYNERLARGLREAVESRVPGVRGLNAETQTNLALREALTQALDKESRSSRYTMGGLIDSPRLWGLIAHGLDNTGTAIPPTLRAALLELLTPSHDVNGGVPQ